MDLSRGARSLLLCVVLSFTPALGQDDPRWQVVPDVNDLDDWNIQPNSTALAKAMNDAAEFVQRFKVPGSAEGWKYRRPQVDAALRQAIGLAVFPPRTPLKPRSVAIHDLGDYTVENIIFESRPGFPVTANLYRSKDSIERERPAILCPIGHILDHGKASAEPQSRCIKLARMGFIVLVYDAIGHGERLIPGNIHHEAQYALLPLGETIAGWMVWDSIRAIDYLVSLPEVDSDRIGITGNSGGGLNALYTAALDPRVAVSTVSGYTFEFGNWMKYAGAHGSCSQLIGLYRHMEWFEIAGLIAPRPLQMLQGEWDSIFPVSGARKAGYRTEALYSLLGYGDLARLDIVPKLGHAYSRPYRERMYGWMSLHLQDKGDGTPLPEGDIETLPENDSRLVCDPSGSVMTNSLSVVDMARIKALEAVSSLPSLDSSRQNHIIRTRLNDLTAPPDEEPHNLMPQEVDSSEMTWATLEKVFFVSEIGQYVPGLLWLPKGSTSPTSTVIILDDRGKSAVAESGLVQALVERGFAVLSVDLRGRGETLGKIGENRDNNYHFVLHSILWGRPLAGRRAFDLKRTVDFLFRRPDLPKENLAVVGLGDGALPALLAAAEDTRIKRLACADFYNSFVSQIIPAALETRQDLVREWNMNATRWGRIQGESYRIDLGSVIPSVLDWADIPELVSLVAPRKVLYCQTRDRDSRHETRFQQVTSKVDRHQDGWLLYEPRESLSAELLIGWLEP